MDKTNLLTCLERGARRAGRLALAEKLGKAQAEPNPVQGGGGSQAEYD